MLSALSIRTPTRMTADFSKNFDKRVKKDTAKVSKAFEKLNKESEERRAHISEKADAIFKHLDEIAKKDVEKLKTLFSEDVESTVDIDDFVEVEDVVTFKSDI
jgi:DNA-binding transcriptional regulator GbsR (MarR family)